MAFIVPNEAERNWLDGFNLLFGGFVPKLRIKLYKNDLDPDEDTELADFVLADFSGVETPQLDGGTVAGVPDGGGRAVLSFDDVIWEHDGGGTGNLVYGYLITNDAGDKFYGAERAPNPVSMSVLGDAITVSPKLKLKSEN